jgi:hypothetical protein
MGFVGRKSLRPYLKRYLFESSDSRMKGHTPIVVADREAES